MNQVDDMLIPRSNRDLFHKLLSAPERVSGTDRGGPPRLFKRLKDTYQIKIKILKMRLRLHYNQRAKAVVGALGGGKRARKGVAKGITAARKGAKAIGGDKKAGKAQVLGGLWLSEFEI